MNKFKAICITINCEECGKEHSQLKPLVISEEDWRKTQELHGEMITHYLYWYFHSFLKRS
ncbi:MAG: hypothetical protein FGO69_08760 [Methanobacterium sp.]|nr:MAG: hypothetical protein FGO69_08760 [Methanobacterium sp.]